jgi:hypothetical protein
MRPISGFALDDHGMFGMMRRLDSGGGRAVGQAQIAA